MLVRLWHLMGAMGIAAFVAIALPASAAIASPDPGHPAGQHVLAKAEVPEPDDDEDAPQNDGEEPEDAGEDDGGGKKKRYAIIGTSGGFIATLGAIWVYIRRARTAYKMGKSGYRLYKWYKRRKQQPPTTKER